MIFNNKLFLFERIGWNFVPVFFFVHLVTNFIFLKAVKIKKKKDSQLVFNLFFVHLKKVQIKKNATYHLTI